jgi:hypothetical protein
MAYALDLCRSILPRREALNKSAPPESTAQGVQRGPVPLGNAPHPFHRQNCSAFRKEKDVMLECWFRAALIALGLLASALALGMTAALPAMADEHAHAAPPYVPGLGELMSANQMRHAKLWFAGEAGNWPLAAYDLDELKEGF